MTYRARAAGDDYGIVIPDMVAFGVPTASRARIISIELRNLMREAAFSSVAAHDAIWQPGVDRLWRCFMRSLWDEYVRRRYTRD